MASVTVVSSGSAVSLSPLPKLRRPSFFLNLLFPLCDVMTLAFTGALVLLVNPVEAFYPGTQPAANAHHFLMLGPIIALVIVTFTWAGLYPGVIHNAVTELRQLFLALTMSFLAMAAVVLLNPGNHGRLATLWLWWAAAMAVTPALRSAVRSLACRKPWWGVPVAVIHTGEPSLEIVRELQAHPEFGLRPVVLLVSPFLARPRHTLPVFDMRLAPAVRACGVERALIVTAEDVSGSLRQDLENCERTFPRLMLFHHATALYNLTVDARQVGSRLAVEVRRDLLLPLPRLAKRSLDLLIVALALPIVTLIVLLLGLLIRIESPGPVLFSHRRIGRDRVSFRTWKLRTMKVDGDQLLRSALAQNDALREEWSRRRKLRHDPRITRVGRFLRRTSLDELPQFWNVVRGEMSLVGPRPIVEEEVAGYGESFSLYCRVTPGLTGLWQVSGRSDVSARDRVRLDSYYVRNWSPWLDLHILARTARVVLLGQGAY